ncbi:hypothetical protein B296_00016252 [Ensete ventricosum]|uniref:Uncharacterized protein n=1 Tax=Ensete ventricosum TaxID=4639 RepID=A0A426ZWS7_ENSVE|nr:hypothetical protein B296_00016252 [Ensete ventricosum]
MLLGTRLEYVGSSPKGSEACREFTGSWPRVSKACQEFTGSLLKEIGSLPRWRWGVHLKKTKDGVEGSRKAYRESLLA